MTTDISKKALERIRKEDIRPETEWRFLLHRSLAWTGISAAAGIGAWSLSMAIFPILSLGTDLPRGEWPRFFLPLLLRPMPLVWIAFVTAFIGIAVIEFRRIGRGYRHRVAAIALGILGIVTIFSVILHTLHVNEASDREFRRNIPPYAAFSPDQKDFWLRAEDGFLIGTVVSERPDGFTIVSPDGTTWDILVTPQTDIRPRADFRIGKDVKMVGKRIGNGRFEADDILPGTGSRMKADRRDILPHDDRPMPIMP